VEAIFFGDDPEAISSAEGMIGCTESPTLSGVEPR